MKTLTKNQKSNSLDILYIKKTGWFCDNRKKDLLDQKLVAKLQSKESKKEISDVK
jgi:hypothetical protein